MDRGAESDRCELRFQAKHRGFRSRREPDLRADGRGADLHGEVWVRFPGCSELAAAAGRDRFGSWKPTHGDGYDRSRESEEVLPGGDREVIFGEGVA